ncbi:hypothetical protein KBB25_04030, partial [Candidatus Gracilibacteria bacterium]|nr:hypothetical protein [Candidatus Gracilibacteria bacterium]
MSFDDLENEALNETTDFNEICKIISFLASSIRARETEYRDDNDNRIENLLLKIQEKRKEYFVKLKIQGILRQPLEGISEEMKDQIMSQNGERYNGHNFDLFVEDNYEYCKWIEWGWDKDKLEISHLRNSGITPNYPDFGYDNRNRSRTQRSFDEMCIYTKLSDNYGVVYSEIGGANKIFKIDDDYKKDLLHREKNFGQLSQNDYAHYVNLFEKSLQSGNSDDLLKLLLIYPELPEDIRVALEKIFSEQIASFDKNPYISLFKEKVSPGVFERILDSHKDTLLEIVDEKKPEIERVINLLSTKFKNIQENNALRFFGYKDEGIDSIDFYLSFIEQDPRSIHPPHYTLYYYLNIRRYLPQYLIDEFETNFDLPIPDPIKNLKTEDQFLALSENTFVSIFGTDVPKLGEMIMWLSGRLSQLKNEIKEKLPEFEEVTPEDVFSSEGVGLSKSGLDIENYFIMMEPRNRINLREKFGIDISDFDLRTQISVLKFLSNRDGSTIDTLSGGIKVIQNPESRRDAFRVLLANEEFPEIEHVLISYARFPEIMLPLYKKYAELVSSFNEVEAFLYKTFKSKFEHEAISKIRELLIQKANTVLIKNVEGINTLYKLTQDARHIENKYEEQDDTDEMPWWVNSKRTEEYQSAVNRVDILKHEILSEIERVNTDT